MLSNLSRSAPQPSALELYRSWVAYVTDIGSGAVTPINLKTGKPKPVIQVGNDPGPIAITPDGKTAYVASFDSGTVTTIDLTIGRPGIPIKVEREPDAIAITPDGTTAYVTNYQADDVAPINLTTTNLALQSLPV